MGPKSELKQTEQANAENTIKITASTASNKKKRSLIEKRSDDDEHNKGSKFAVFSDDGTIVNRERLHLFVDNDVDRRVLSSHDQQGLNTPQN